MRIFAVGDQASFSKTITEADIVLFAGVSGDFNPIHVSEQHAKQSRFKARIAHGALIAALISNVIGNQLPGNGSIYLSSTLKFLRPTFIGDTVTAIATIKAIRHDKPVYTLETRCINQKSEVLCLGEAAVLWEGDPFQ
jgi:3-hydroxybutyryl-CoA dehydratase